MQPVRLSSSPLIPSHHRTSRLHCCKVIHFGAAKSVSASSWRPKINSRTHLTQTTSFAQTVVQLPPPSKKTKEFIHTFRHRLHLYFSDFIAVRSWSDRTLGSFCAPEIYHYFGRRQIERRAMILLRCSAELKLEDCGRIIFF